jgi:Legionella pneumophila major outer membrane protein precursor
MSRFSKASALVASAAALPLADPVAAQILPPGVPGTTTYSFEGGVSFSNLSNSNYPAGAVPFIPQDLDKVGSPPRSFGDLDPGRRTGGYGSFSTARNIDAVWDWRFSAGFNVFGTSTRSADASQLFTGSSFSAINTAAITERDRFRLYTADFDFGRNWTTGIVQVRAFAGLRSLYTNDRFDAFFHTEGTDKTGFLTNTTTITDSLSQGRSTFFGLGPRAGMDFFAGSTFGVVGNISGALLVGSRQSSVFTTDTIVVNGGSPTFGTNRVASNETTYVGNISGSLGAAWQFSPMGQLVVGYKVDKWYNVRESFAFFGLSRKEDIFIQTPFIRATLRF